MIMGPQPGSRVPKPVQQQNTGDTHAASATGEHADLQPDVLVYP